MIQGSLEFQRLSVRWSFGDTKQGKRIHRGLQMCMSNLADDIQEYIRSLFIGTYIAPLTITAYLYVKSGQELQRQEGPLAVAVFESRAKDSASYSRQGSNTSNEIALSIHRKRGSESVGTSATAAFSNLSASYDLDDAELDVQKEKRTQKYLIFMVTAYAVCLCPLMVLRLARSAFQETYDNSSHIDMTFVLFIWVAFLPALITPCLYASWQMSRPAKERLRGYFRFSNRRHTRVCEDGHQRRSSSRASRHHSNLASPLPPRSRAGSSNSGNGSAVLGAGSSVSASRSARSSGVLPPESPDLSVASYSPYKTSNFIMP
ncbi:uncharacterized protein LOC100679867 isoform X3 [Nasonia vitripennis]|uniref:G-protein coupled receptors family 1 profile domain-containing protein n=1 Tax=Nasonia vitripennis TaxID=7425 RepID=A0A7M7PZ61_NASVI|nr:uncharacterized protein LOC100679867 isoform X3 [Nasonia vitripennis]